MSTYLSPDIDNPFFYGFMRSQEKQEIDEAIQQIANECGDKIEAAELTRQLEKRGIDPRSLSPSELNLIDSVFDCFE